MKFDRFSFEKEAEKMIGLSAWNGHILYVLSGYLQNRTY